MLDADKEGNLASQSVNAMGAFTSFLIRYTDQHALRDECVHF